MESRYEIFVFGVTEHGGGGYDLKEESIRDTMNTFQHDKEYMRVGEVCQGSDEFV